MFVFAAQNKRLNVQFAGGEEPQDMELAMRAIDDGRIDVAPWLGERIGPDTMTFEVRRDLPDTATTSAMPHNALEDARALARGARETN